MRVSSLTPFERVMARTRWEGECLVFTGARSSGYGSIFYKHRALRAHRVVAEHHLGPAPPGKPCVLHSCDNPPCVLIDHLRYGTQAENSEDKVERERSADTRGAANANARLMPHQVNLIRQWRAEGMTTTALGEFFGVTPPLVSQICLGQKWASLPAVRVLHRRASSGG